MDPPLNMISNNPAEILLTLDQQLDHEVSLVLYGRAALCLGLPVVRRILQAAREQSLE